MSTADSTAAFFAKKKKKKAFKGFNANKIDASSITTTVHVDAPAVSTDPSASVISALASTSLVDGTSPEQETATEQWDDEAMAAATTRKAAGATSQQQTAELLDMKALDTKRRVQDDIAERMRVEETKAALAAAREGMEREAQRLKENEEQKETKGTAAPTSRFGAASASVGGTGGKWVAPHMRSGTAASLTRSRMSGLSQKLDTKDESLFPDLASADAILEQQQKHEQTAYKVPKKSPVGGGATWASSRLTGSRSVTSRPATAPKPAPAPEPTSKPEPPKEPKLAPAQAAGATIQKPVKPLGTGVKKKKKKDLSTFKPTS